MGQTLPDFQQAQINAASYAETERKHKRRTVLYLAATLVSSLITLIISPAYLLPTLIVSAAAYTAYRYGGTLFNRAKQWYLDKKSQRQVGDGENILEPLTNTKTQTVCFKNLAHNELANSIKQKSEKISRYEEMATLQEDAPLTYYDQKHKRALFQYSMLNAAKSVTLQGDGSFLEQMATERHERRALKIKMLETIKNDFINNHKISISLKNMSRSPIGTCVLGGNSENISAFMTTMKTLNQSEKFSLVSMPNDPDKVNDCILKTLLPVLLDMDNILKTVTPVETGVRVISAFRKPVAHEYGYSITSEILDARIQTLKKERSDYLDSMKVINEPVNENSGFEITSSYF